jgi:hypothetical protein
MTRPSTPSGRRSLPAALIVALIGTLAVNADAAQAQGQPAAGVAKGVSPTGTLFRRAAEGKPWQMVKEGEAVPAGELLLGLPGAAVVAADGAVRLTFVSDLSGTSPLPVVETAVVLREGKDVDLDVFIERGRVDLTNVKDKGPARFRVRVLPESEGGVVVAEPGASVAIEVFGSWPAGVPFKKNAGPEHAPTKHLVALVLKGEVTVKLGERQFAMKAPPGPALVEMDTVAGADFTPRRLDTLPEWAEQKGKPEVVAKKKALIEEFRRLITTKSLDAALDTFVNSDDPDKRRGAVNAMGATDDLKRLGTVLATTKYADTWDYAVRALRHWIGRGPGQDQKLYDGLIKEAKFNELEAETVLQLLHSFSDEQLSRPELYEVLIDFLDHDKLAIRGLAHWHLSRLAPDGRKIGHNPTESKEARQKAVKEWRKLIPPGKLPPPPKADGK